MSNFDKIKHNSNMAVSTKSVSDIIGILSRLLNISQVIYRIAIIIDPLHQARQTRPNSGGVAEGQPRFDKGGVAKNFYFLRVKNRTF